MLSENEPKGVRTCKFVRDYTHSLTISNMNFQTPTGMRDLLDEDLRYFQRVEKICQEIAEFYNFKKIETPILENSGLFEKGTGVNTEIVQKQMFLLRTKGGDCLTLRPEGTPAILRAYFENGMENLPKPVKLWHMGPFFRYERPQAGRYRQFHQVGFEVLGADSWIIDAQVIQLFYNILKNLGFKNLSVEVNSIGDSQCRSYYKKVLMSFLRSRKDSLCPDCKRRLKTNPLRILDCKNERCKEIIKKGAPQILDHLCHDCNSQFKNVLEALEEMELPYVLNPYLVRGLDYYSKTVFEISSESEQGISQGSLAGGGRYDYLSKLLGGKDTPGCGGAAGVERIVNLMKERGDSVSKQSNPKIFLAQVGDLSKRKSLKLIEEFRKAKIKVAESLHKDSLSLQLKIADKMKVKYVLIMGQKEALDNEVILRDMKSGKQKVVAIDKAVKETKKII